MSNDTWLDADVMALVPGHTVYKVTAIGSDNIPFVTYAKYTNPVSELSWRCAWSGSALNVTAFMPQPTPFIKRLNINKI